jgi:hypothetical protein
MAYSTHYLGHIRVRPALNEAEFAYLTAFGETAHVVEDPHRYHVSDNPRAPLPVTPDRGYRILERRDDLPDVMCPWVPACGGECLAIGRDDGQQRDAAKWLQFLLDHFLRPGAEATRSDLDEFAEFTFDHTLGAVVAAHRSDTGRLWLIRPEGDEITEEIVWWGQAEW